MNILEAEDMVKGLPDEVLFQYAQNPPPQIPQYLTISEVQRRQDMRQRFQAQQQGAEPTIKDKVLQGGIAAAGGPPPGAAPPGAPMQQPMTGAPMPPMSMAQGGLTPGGIVRMQLGGSVPELMAELRAARAAGDAARANQIETLLREQRSRDPVYSFFDRISGPRETAPVSAPAVTSVSRPVVPPVSVDPGIPAAAAAMGATRPNLQREVTQSNAVSSQPSQPAPVVTSPFVAPSAAPAATSSPTPSYFTQRTTEVDPERELDKRRLSLADYIKKYGLIRPAQGTVINQARSLASQGKTAEAEALLRREGINPEFALGRAETTAPPMEAAVVQSTAPIVQQDIPANFDFLAANRAAMTDQISPTIMPRVPRDSAGNIASNVPPTNRQAVADVPPGGIADAGEALGTIPPGATPRPSGMSFESLLSGALRRERSPEMQQFMDMQRQIMEQGIPKPVDLSPFIQSAQQRQQEARDEARRMAIAGTLMNLGSGVMSGDAAEGLRRATQTAMGTLAEGRREAAVEGRTAEQLQLQAAQQERQSAIDAMRLRSETLGNIANIVSGEDKASRSDQLAAAQIMATYQTALARENRENARQGRTDANSMRAARTSALQQASQYLRSYLESTGEEVSDEEFARRVRDMAMMLEPESFAMNTGEVSWNSLGGGR